MNGRGEGKAKVTPGKLLSSISPCSVAIALPEVTKGISHTLKGTFRGSELRTVRGNEETLISQALDKAPKAQSSTETGKTLSQTS